MNSSFFKTIAFLLAVAGVSADPPGPADDEQGKTPVEHSSGRAASEDQAAPQLVPKDPLSWTKGRNTLKLGIDMAAQYAAESNSWWNLSRTFAASSNFNPDLGWLELYFKPSLTNTFAWNEKTSLYAGVSMVASANVDRDVFDEGNSGRVLLENAYAGIRHKTDGGLEFDFSGGAQPYKIAGGFLISVGGGNGFERGATSLAPRRAWEMTGIGKVGYKRFSATGFYLDPNELGSSDTGTRLVGADFQYKLGNDEYLGVAYLHSPRSTFTYIQAPITFIEEGRRGLNTIHAYGKVRPARARMPGLLVQGDYARQWNNRIQLNAWAMNFDVNNTFIKTKWLPSIGYSYRHYSGDDPKTPGMERFDSLYYDGSPATYSSGSNGSFNFYNSNIVAHRVKYGMVFNPANLFDAFYFHIRAAKRNSPIQFGQGFRFEFEDGVPVINTGLPDTHLADDLYFQYTRVITRNIYFTSGVGISFPGKGLQRISRNSADLWVGALANLVVVF
jgi:hypothetical protein